MLGVMGLAPTLRLRVMLTPGMPFGPGKADLLEAVGAHGSIAAAGRSLGMSYQRAWTLVAAMNAHFRVPVVAAAKGGRAGGGAALTPFGQAVLAAYRGIERRAARAAAKELEFLAANLAPALPAPAPIRATGRRSVTRP